MSYKYLIILALLAVVGCGQSFSGPLFQDTSTVGVAAAGTGGDPGTGGTGGLGGAGGMSASGGAGGAVAAGGMGGTGGAISCDCVSDLSATGSDMFSVAFHITTKSMSQLPILNQRSSCDATHPFWAVGLTSAGVIQYELASYAGYDSGKSTEFINDGLPHSVVVERVAPQKIHVLVDGKSVTTMTTATESLHSLAPLEIGTETACNLSTPAAAKITSVCLTAGCIPQ